MLITEDLKELNEIIDRENALYSGPNCELYYINWGTIFFQDEKGRRFFQLENDLELAKIQIFTFYSLRDLFVENHW